MGAGSLLSICGCLLAQCEVLLDLGPDSLRIRRMLKLFGVIRIWQVCTQVVEFEMMWIIFFRGHFVVRGGPALRLAYVFISDPFCLLDNLSVAQG